MCPTQWCVRVNVFKTSVIRRYGNCNGAARWWHFSIRDRRCTVRGLGKKARKWCHYIGLVMCHNIVFCYKKTATYLQHENFTANGAFYVIRIKYLWTWNFLSTETNYTTVMPSGSKEKLNRNTSAGYLWQPRPTGKSITLQFSTAI